MVYAVRVACHVYLDIYLDIYLNIHLDIHLDIHLNIHLNVHLHLTSSYLRLTSPLTASRPPLHFLVPQSVNAIKVHSLVFPSSSTMNLRS